MPKRRSQGQPPQIVFTADFHQLVQGELRPGPCVIRYDPFRIVPPSEFGMPRPIELHIAFHPTKTRWKQVVTIPPGRLRASLADPAGQNFMLELTFDLPIGCDELECWFCCAETGGAQRWDSAYGANYWLRFPLHDLANPRGSVIANPNAGVDRLQIEVNSIAAVEGINARPRLTHPPGPRQTIQLQGSSTSEENKAWSIPDEGVRVPCGATAVFDLVYTVGDRQFTDDNEGTWYIAAPSSTNPHSES